MQGRGGGTPPSTRSMTATTSVSTSKGKKAAGSVVRLPYFLIPGLDLTSRAYQKATSLGSLSTSAGKRQKISNEITAPVTLFPDQALQAAGKSLILVP